MKRQEKSWCPNPKAIRQEDNYLSLRKGSTSLLYLGRWLYGWGPPTLWWSICFTQSTDLNVNLIQNTLTETPRIMFDQISRYPVALSSWHMKFTTMEEKQIWRGNQEFCFGHVKLEVLLDLKGEMYSSNWVHRPVSLRCSTFLFPCASHMQSWYEIPCINIDFKWSCPSF